MTAMCDPVLILPFERGVWDPRLIFRRASVATCWDARGVLRVVAADTPRLDHDPLTGEGRGLLIEEARTNLVTRSDQFSLWSRQGTAGVTADDAVAPDGTTTADRLGNVDGHANRIAKGPIAVTGGASYTLSAYLKGSGAAVLGMNTVGGTAVSQSSTVPLSPAWTRHAVTLTMNADNTGVDAILYGASGTSSFHAWGAQVEQGAFPTSYIPTAGATVTRQADVCTLDGEHFADVWNPAEGTIVIGFRFTHTMRGTSDYPTVFSMSDGSFSNRISVIRGLASHWFTSIAAAGTETGSMTRTPSDAQAHVAALAFGTDAALVFDGAVAGTDASVSVPAVDRFNIGSNAAGGSQIVGHIHRLALYPRRLDTDTLQALTM